MEGFLMQPASTRTVFDVITDFLISDPIPEAILEYRLPAELEQRARQLLERKRAEQLSFEE